MTRSLALMAGIAGAAGSLGLYLSSRHQRVLARPLPPGAARFVSAVLMIAALVLLFGSLQAPAAIYVYATALMLFLVVILFRPEGLLPRPVRRYFPGWRP